VFIWKNCNDVLLKNPAKTILGWLAGLSWFKLEVAGFSWSPSLA